MKLLLLTDIPPCKNYTAGLAIGHLCSVLPKGSLACFAVVNPHVDARLDADFSWMPIEYAVKPAEVRTRTLPGKLGEFAAFCAESYTARFQVDPLVQKAIAFGKAQGVDAVWAVLQGQTLIRMAGPVAAGLGVPLLTQVWDPPEWWLRAHNVDAISRRRILKEFDATQNQALSCAAASWGMAEAYNSEYSCKAMPVIPSIDPGCILTPEPRVTPGARVTIGLAGQLYSQAEWVCLLEALQQVDSRIAGKNVVVRMLGRTVSANASGNLHIEFLGWRSQPDTIRLLSECDILYCPYWFDPAFEKEARQSFPSKLVTYLAAGRAILFHGPEYASPGRFLAQHDAGAMCRSLDRADLRGTIERLITDEAQYARLVANARKAFLGNLTPECMLSQFESFLGVYRQNARAA